MRMYVIPIKDVKVTALVSRTNYLAHLYVNATRLDANIFRATSVTQMTSKRKMTIFSKECYII